MRDINAKTGIIAFLRIELVAVRFLDLIEPEAQCPSCGIRDHFPCLFRTSLQHDLLLYPKPLEMVFRERLDGLFRKFQYLRKTVYGADDEVGCKEEEDSHEPPGVVHVHKSETFECPEEGRSSGLAEQFGK